VHTVVEMVASGFTEIVRSGDANITVGVDVPVPVSLVSTGVEPEKIDKIILADVLLSPVSVYGADIPLVRSTGCQHAGQ